MNCLSCLSLCLLNLTAQKHAQQRTAEHPWAKPLIPAKLLLPAWPAAQHLKPPSVDNAAPRVCTCQDAYLSDHHDPLSALWVPAGTAGLNVPMFIALRRFTLLCTIVLERLLLKKQHEKSTLGAVAVMIGGAACAHMQIKATDLQSMLAAQ